MADRDIEAANVQRVSLPGKRLAAKPARTVLTLTEQIRRMDRLVDEDSPPSPQIGLTSANDDELANIKIGRSSRHHPLLCWTHETSSPLRVVSIHEVGLH
ncbi:hypothetical protein ACG83_30715 [Frankia sp. R43]|uniref:hypothetical protein n=1 Tax=Frankia sp. R43 TaxID=269536 RepID=UPI0006CA0A26|nr:hypothetical protein [Frankia sp. R43]KPM51951.1 hypothetical protein ACG83_30715 [Frankia sp. R43]